jgi:hypothetical protein
MQEGYKPISLFYGSGYVTGIKTSDSVCLDDFAEICSERMEFLVVVK